MRATKPDLSFPRRDDGLDHLPFLSLHALSLAEAVLSGEPRITRFAPTPVPVPPAFTGLPDRDVVSNATPSWGIPQKVECRFVCTGLWAQRRTRPSAREADHASFVGCERFLNALADVPFPSWVFPQRTSPCHRCVRRQEWSSCLRDGPI